jgi:hypothetical protein
MSNNIVDKPTNPWDDNKYWTYPGSDEVAEEFGPDVFWECYKWRRDGANVILHWCDHSRKYSEERAKFLNKLVADGWKFVSFLSETPESGQSVLDIVVSR